VCAITDEKIAVNLYSSFAQRGNFFQERDRIEYDAIPDHASAAVAHDSAGHKLQDKALPVDDDGMPGVMPAGIARHDGEPFREHIDNLAFAFVAPLRADYDNCLAFRQIKLREFPP
jgi:hypothetical protein